MKPTVYLAGPIAKTTAGEAFQCNAVQKLRGIEAR
jgi:hypothetical protein